MLFDNIPKFFSLDAVGSISVLKIPNFGKLNIYLTFITRIHEFYISELVK